MNEQNNKDSEKSILQLRQALRKNLEAVDQEIISRLNKSIPLINDIGTHLINAAGKRLRPLLTLAMAAQFNNYSKNPILLAAAVEFIHTATLLHDDVVDESNLRRGKKTANIIWGNEFSVLAGDFLFAQSFELMVETESIEALSSLASASCKITQGEFQQMQIANKPETSIENYLEVIGKKTAELFGASCKSGVIVSEGNAEQQNAAYDYGFNLGLAFQIVDDLMDFNNLPNKMGKNLGDDFKLGKTTLPVILAWQKSNAKEKQFWIKTLKELNQEPHDFMSAIEIFNKYNIFEDCKKKTQEFISLSIKCLEILPDTEIEYYFKATSNSGKVINRPIVAPQGGYQFRMTPPSYQSIQLFNGWNLISSFLNTNQSVDSLFESISEHIVIVKNNEGTAYLPDWNFNGIGIFNSLEGYFVKTNLSSTLNLFGSFLNPDENPIILNNGWSTISYLRVDEVSAELIFAELEGENNLVIAKNYLGQAYLPEWDFNGIGNLTPGQGYQLKVYQADTLNFLPIHETY